MRFALSLGEFEHHERPFDIHFVRRHRGELAARRQDGRQMKNPIDLEFGEDAIEQLRVEDRPNIVLSNAARESRFQRCEVEHDDGSFGVGRQAIDQAMPNFAAGPGNEHDRFSRHEG